MSLSNAIKLLDKGDVKQAKKVLKQMKFKNAERQKAFRESKRETNS